MSIIKKKISKKTYVQSFPNEERTYFYYPKNLRTKTSFLLWDLANAVLVLLSFVLAVFIWDATKLKEFFILPILVAILTAKIEDVTIMTRLKEVYMFIFTPQKHRNNNNPNSTQKLCGGIWIDENNCYITETGCYALWEVNPFNLAVLAPDETEILVRALTNLMIQCPDIEIMAIDGAKNYDQNIAFLKKRIEEETNPKIRKLLETDLEQISSLSLSANTTRKYLFIYKFRNNVTDNQKTSIIQRYSKGIQDAGFVGHQLNKEEIKKVLSNYFDLVGELPDYDGTQYIKKDEKEVDVNGIF